MIRKSISSEKELRERPPLNGSGAVSQAETQTEKGGEHQWSPGISLSFLSVRRSVAVCASLPWWTEPSEMVDRREPSSFKVSFFPSLLFCPSSVKSDHQVPVLQLLPAFRVCVQYWPSG